MSRFALKKALDQGLLSSLKPRVSITTTTTPTQCSYHGTTISNSNLLHQERQMISQSIIPFWTNAFHSIPIQSSSSTTTIRFKSSLPIKEDDDDDEDEEDEIMMDNHPTNTTTTTTDFNITNNDHHHNQEEVRDYTSDKTKSGTPSPWAVFDAWGAGEGIVPPLDPQDEAKLTAEAVRIPTTTSTTNNGIEEDEKNVPNETEILNAYEALLRQRSSVHMGYPYNLVYNHEELFPFMKYSINNLGDPFVPSNYGVHSRQFEVAVIDFFADLWKIDKGDYWGYVTTCGTEGNLHGILLARECHPNGILYTSQESHYSLFKAAKYYKMDCKAIPTLPMGEIDYDVLAREIEKNQDRSIIINVNIGTTVKGAVDNLDRILRILKGLGVPRERFHIHCDGALFAMMMPFIDYAPEISFQKPIDSIAVSGHKMLGCPMPCGVALARKAHVKNVEQRIDYLNSVDTTIMGSRNGQAALYLWYSLRKKGIQGIQQDVMQCMNTAKYLIQKINSIGLACRLNDLSCTVVLERPMDDKLIKRWQLACEEDIAHVVVMPNVTRDKIDQFVQELHECKEQNGRIQPFRLDSPLTKLSCSSWGGEVVTPIHNFKQ